MTDLTQYEYQNPLDASKGDKIFLLAVGDESATLHEAAFITGTHYGFTASLKGSKTGLPFNASEWTIYTPKKYPLPAREDVSNLLANAIMGQNLTLAELTDQILSLFKGEVETPIVVRGPQAPVEAEPEPVPDFGERLAEDFPEMYVPSDPVAEETFPPDHHADYPFQD